MRDGIGAKDEGRGTRGLEIADPTDPIDPTDSPDTTIPFESLICPKTNPRPSHIRPIRLMWEGQESESGLKWARHAVPLHFSPLFPIPYHL